MNSQPKSYCPPLMVLLSLVLFSLSYHANTAESKSGTTQIYDMSLDEMINNNLGNIDNFDLNSYQTMPHADSGDTSTTQDQSGNDNSARTGSNKVTNSNSRNNQTNSVATQNSNQNNTNLLGNLNNNNNASSKVIPTPSVDSDSQGTSQDAIINILGQNQNSANQPSHKFEKMNKIDFYLKIKSKPRE